MKNNKNIGIIVTVLGALLTCCLCPLALESLTILSRVNRGVGFYGRFFARSGASVYYGQTVCAGVLALILLVIGIVILVQARGNGSTNNSTPSQ
jgi:hypothetical protein